MQVGAALVLGDARDFPPVHRTFHEPIAVVSRRELIDIRKVENMRAIVGQRSVVASEIRRIARCSPVFAPDAQGLPERVIGEVRQASGLFIPGHLQGVVVRIHLVVNNFQGAQAIVCGYARTGVKGARSVRLSGVVTCIGAACRASPAVGRLTCRVTIGQPAIVLEQTSKREIIDLVKVVVIVAQVIGFAADVSDFQQALPWQALGHSEAVALGARLLVILRIQGRESARYT